MDASSARPAPFRREDLERLVAVQAGPAVSIFMPTHRAGSEIQQDPIRLKNLLRRADEHLQAGGHRTREAKQMLEPAYDLVHDDLFWRHQAEGLALFAAPGTFAFYRVPLAFTELVMTGERFHLKPLLPLLSGSVRVLVLAVSLHGVKLFDADRFGIAEVPLEGVPASLEEALRFDVEEKQLQLHTRAPALKGDRASMFHGHGATSHENKDRIRQFFQQVEKGVRRALRDERAPLVLAAVEYLQPIYREVNTYPGLIDEVIAGNPEGTRPEVLREQAMALMEPALARAERQAAEIFRQLAGTGRASNDLAEIVPAAHHGRVDRLFVALGVQRWGRFDPEAGRVEQHEAPQPGDQDLLDLAAIHTILGRGTVYAVDAGRLPDRAPHAAIFRY